MLFMKKLQNYDVDFIQLDECWNNIIWNLFL